MTFLGLDIQSIQDISMWTSVLLKQMVTGIQIFYWRQWLLLQRPHSSFGLGG